MINSFFKNKKVLVVGLGKSGVAAARLLKGEGAQVFVTESKNKKLVKPFFRKLPPGVTVETGRHTFFKDLFDLVIISPGVPWDAPFLHEFRKRQTPVWSELELGWRFIEVKKPHEVVAVTGTNGKTTTTSLIAHILKTAKKQVVVGGNIGTPLCALVKKVTSKTHVVLEVSSYQLEAQETFHPTVGVILNLSPDHLARHKTMPHYAAMKKRLLMNMTSQDVVVYNRQDSWCRWMVKKTKAHKRSFPSRAAQSLSMDLKLPGEHNRHNAMAAVEACLQMGISTPSIQKGIRSFKGVPHRIQFVRSVNGVKYFNDSKATNVDSTAVAVKSFQEPLILILGGEHKGSSYAPLIPLMRKKVKFILTVGEAASLIEKDLAGQFPIYSCQTIAKAVRVAHQQAKKGDIVLLSPACASFDQFKNFEHRGDVFTALVKNLSL